MVMVRLYQIIVLAASLLLLILGLSYGSASVALRAYDSWVNYESPFVGILSSINPVSVSGEPVAKHVVFILLDGLSTSVLEDLVRSDASIGKLVSLGALYVNGLANMPSYSVPARASILSGTPPEVNGVSSNDYKGLLRIDSLPVIAKSYGYKILCSGDSSFEMLFSQVIDECASVSEGAGHGALSLAYGLKLLERYERAGYKVFMWIGVADIDLIGHKAGGLSIEYNESARNILYLLLDFISGLEEKGLLRDTLLVILNDHGFKRMGHHGGPEPEVRRVFLTLIGPGVRPGVYNVSFTHNDVAPTISMLMGWRIPSSSIGRVIGEGLSIPSSRLEAYTRASMEQEKRVVRAMSELVGLKLDEDYSDLVATLASSGRNFRLTQVTVGFLVLLVALLLTLRVAMSKNLLGELLTIALLVLVYELVFRLYYKLTGGPASLSDIYSFEGFTNKIMLTTLVSSIAVGLILGLLELTPYKRGFSRSLIVALSTILLVILLSIGYATPFYVNYGATVRFPFPEWGGALLFFLSLMKASFTGFIGLPVLIVSTLALIIVNRILESQFKLRQL